MKQFTLFVIPSLLLFQNAVAQNHNVSIGTAAANNKALLSLTSTNKGLFIPGTATALRTGITTTPPGLLIYNTEFDDFFYYAGSDGKRQNEIRHPGALANACCESASFSRRGQRN
ncbi:MAG: hypothetical protein ABIX01_10770 [Chitinophagaceae bacterium]